MNCCCGSKFVKYIWIVIGLVVLGLIIFSLTSCGNKEVPHQGHIPERDAKTPEIDYYTCGMHPSVRVSAEEYNKGKVNCPICNMKLTPVYKEKVSAKEIYYGCGIDTEGKCPKCDSGKPDERCICAEHSFAIKGVKLRCPVCGEPLRELTKEEADKLKGVVSRVRIKGEQAELAGVKTQAVRKMHLFKEIRTVGRVAYDPRLAVAEDEFIASLKAFDKIKGGDIEEIRERAFNLVESSKRKLRLLGLSEEQIKEIEGTRQVHTNLILPEKKMWIYGELYEYELNWVKAGEEITVITSALPGEEFKGVIASINPVLNPRTRSLTFRAEVENPDLKLKPEMYADIVIRSMYTSPDGEHMVLAIPKNAVLDTGTRKIVWVDKGGTEYEGRIVIIGPEASGDVHGKISRFYPVIKGLSEGEIIVTRANFLIDSQSQITGAAAAAYGGALGGEEAPKAMPPGHQH